jgi:hypothetical protein
MKTSKLLNTAIAGMMVFGLAVMAAPSSPASASSHREAPGISGDPKADPTDVYAFVSPDNTNTVTMIANWIPLEQPQGGPNFYTFDDNVTYELNVDVNGDGYADIKYQWNFHTAVQNPNTFLYNTGPITSLNDPDYNIRQYYDVTKLELRNSGGYRKSIVAQHVPVPPVNIGPRSTPNDSGQYEAMVAAAVANTSEGGRVFAGQRDDSFFVDLGSIFDLAGLRPLNPFHLLPLPAAPGVDGVAGYNAHTTSIQVPKSVLRTFDNDVIGVWAASYRAKTRVLNGDGTERNSGRQQQIARLGMPLTNEVLIPLGRKDYWNSQDPSGDSQFDSYILSPEPAGLENLLYPVLTDTQTTNRVDLLAVFHTGVPGLNTLARTDHADMIRLNMTIPPSHVDPNAVNRLGVLSGELDGFPNGRRLGDDIVDIELQAVACAYGAVGGLVYSLTGNCDPAIYNGFPNNAVGDGVDANDKQFLAHFPYQATPFRGYEAQPPTAPDNVTKAALGFLGGAAGLGLLAAYRRRKARKA